jgi:hypothetical protein
MQVSIATPKHEPSGLILVDAHVHIYASFKLAHFFRSASENFLRNAHTDSFTAFLFLTETSSESWFRQLMGFAEEEQIVGDAGGATWTVHRTGEPESLRVTGPGGPVLFIVAGRQIVTRESLEVLALGTAESFADGLALSQVVDRVRSTGALPVIPWGFGKWLGNRGATLTRYIESKTAGDLFLGDNSGRPSLWPEPFHFKLARQKGIRILPGSDPLPMASQAWRPGSYGFSFHASLSADSPWRSVKAAFLDGSFNPRPYGAREKPYRFIRNQILMQLQKRRRPH